LRAHVESSLAAGANAKVRLREALERLVHLHDVWGKKAKAAEWRTKLSP
jgi:hypothetical protein